MAVFAMWLVLAVFMFRLGGLLLDRHYADTLCTTTAVYLLVDLYRQDVLARPDYRRALMNRFDVLARSTQLLMLRYASKHPATQVRLQRHFREMIAYIRERQAWAVTPTVTTLDDLRRDIRALARIYITGRYGEFTWEPRPDIEPDPQLPWWMTFLVKAKRILALGLPLLGMGYLLQHPETLATLGASSELVSLMFIAWLLLALDSVLHLGVVSGLVGLAKGIKELK